jgi:YHS domain-containing protein
VSKRAVVLGSLVGIVGLTVGVLVLAGGCQKEVPAAPQSAQKTETMAMPNHAAADQTAVKAVAGEQTTCPVMGGPIDKNVFVEHQGKKVYFCCPACVEKFQADPEKYLAKLPQFAK